MFELIADITAQKVYDMDNHMFNWITAAITILSIIIAVITLIAAIAGFFSFKNMGKKIDSSKKAIDKDIKKYKEEINKNVENYKKDIDNQNKKLQEIEDLKNKLNLEVMKMKQINAHIITNNIHNTIYQLIKSSGLREISLRLLELYNSIIELISIIPNEFLNAQQYESFLEDVVNVLGWVDVIRKETIVQLNKKNSQEKKVETDKEENIRINIIKRWERIYKNLNGLKAKVSLQKINTNGISKETGSEIQHYLEEIDKSMNKIDKMTKELINTK